MKGWCSGCKTTLPRRRTSSMVGIYQGSSPASQAFESSSWLSPLFKNPCHLFLPLLSISNCCAYPNYLTWYVTLESVWQWDAEQAQLEDKTPQSSLQGLHDWLGGQERWEVACWTCSTAASAWHLSSLGAVAESQDDHRTDGSQSLPFLLCYKYLWVFCLG